MPLPATLTTSHILFVTHSSPQPFWHQGPVWGKTIFLQTEGGVGVVPEWFKLFTLCTSFLLLLHQFHFRSSGLDPWGWGPQTQHTSHIHLLPHTYLLTPTSSHLPPTSSSHIIFVFMSRTSALALSIWNSLPNIFRASSFSASWPQLNLRSSLMRPSVIALYQSDTSRT